MGGSLFHETVFGPVKSRRLGVSLGINLLPRDYKYCTFNCIYCECGWTHRKAAGSGQLPSRKELKALLGEKLAAMKAEGQIPDAITFAGNGEPTIHPEFPEIIKDTISLRDRYYPEARVTVLSNASMLHRKDVFDALLMVDENIQKLDAGTEKTFQQINQPCGKLKLEKLVGQLKDFDGAVIIQSLFLRGVHKGQYIDNTTGAEVEAWIGHLRHIRPRYVMIYPIDRATPEEALVKVPFDELSQIAKKVRDAGIRTKVFD